MKVGDYVRTKDDFDNQLINKIKEIYDNDVIETDKGYWDNEHIIKSSPNIIDLIEEGDYVNGYKVIGITEEYIDLQKGLDTQKVLLVLNGKVYEQAIMIREKDIKSIVTKEQFKEMEYRIGDD